MADFEKGQTFHDTIATNFSGQKGKYFIGITEGEFDNDKIVCFFMNTENNMSKYSKGCNKQAQKFIIAPNTFSFIKKDTSIMLSQACIYLMSEIYESNIQLLDKADENFCRQVKNCIDMDSIEPVFQKLIKECYKK